MKMSKKEVYGIIKYAVAGGMTTGVNYLIYFVLLATCGQSSRQTGVYLGANSAAWLGAVLFSYVMNRKMVFHSKNDWLAEFIHFAGMRLATLAAENLLLYLMIDQVGFSGQVSKIAVSFVTVVLNYAACRWKIFNSRG